MVSQIEDIPAGFKMTELGLIPAEWQLKKLSNVIELIRNGLTKTQNKSAKGIPVTRIETIANEFIDISKVGFIEDISDDFVAQYKLVNGDILFSHINSEFHLGKTAIYHDEVSTLLHGMNLLLIRSNMKMCLPDYLNFLFKFYRVRGIFIGLAARAVGQASINQGKLKDLDMVLPPLPEQRAIAHVLSTIQHAIEAQDIVIAAARDLEKSLMRHLFSYGPVPVNVIAQMTLSKTEIGEVPAHWKVENLGANSQISTGTTPSTSNTEYYQGDIPFVKTGEIINRPIDSAAIHISEQALNDYNLKLFPPGTVFLAMYGQGKTRGQVALLRIAATTSQNTAAIVPSNNLKAEFLYLYLMSQYEALRSTGSQGHISHLNLSYVKQINLPIPSLFEQEQIVNGLNSVQNKIKIEENRKSVLQILFKTMLHLLMTGQLRVNDIKVDD